MIAAAALALRPVRGHAPLRSGTASRSCFSPRRGAGVSAGPPKRLPHGICLHSERLRRSLHMRSLGSAIPSGGSAAPSAGQHRRWLQSVLRRVCSGRVRSVPARPTARRSGLRLWARTVCVPGMEGLPCGTSPQPQAQHGASRAAAPVATRNTQARGLSQEEGSRGTVHPQAPVLPPEAYQGPLSRRTLCLTHRFGNSTRVR